MKYYNKIWVLVFFGILVVGCQGQQVYQGSSKTIIWEFPPLDLHKRMFYGSVKSSEEQMYYITLDKNGKITKSDKKYYKTGNIFQHNFRIEFDSLGRRKKFNIYSSGAGKSNNRGGAMDKGQYGFSYQYDDKGREKGHKTYNKDTDGEWYSTSGEEIFYDSKGNEVKNIIYWCDSNGENKWIKYRSAFKYNEKGLMIDSEIYTRDWEDEPEILERAFGEEPITYEYDDEGRVIKRSRKKGETNHYYYKNDTLYRETKELYGRTNEYIYYPNGVEKSIKLRTTLVTGDFEFMETGDITTYNGQKVAEYMDYDQFGNWITRIMYDQYGKPESYTERKIEYYE